MTVHGRLDGTLQRDGELTPDAVGKALGKEIQSYYAIPEVVEQRPPALCQGCGHRDMYEALNEVIAEYNGTAKVFGDIGCLYLGSFASFPCDRFLYRYGGLYHDGEGCFRRGCIPGYLRDWRFYVYPFRYDWFAGLREREHEYHHRYLR